MAIRNIVKDTDEYNMLHKKCRPVTDFNQKLWDLLDDMAETMYKAEGVGLAGPQVGMLRRVFVIDVGDGILEPGGAAKLCQGPRAEPQRRVV